MSGQIFLALRLVYPSRSTSQHPTAILACSLSGSILFLALIALGIALHRPPSGVSRRLILAASLFMGLGYLALEALGESSVDFRPALLFALISVCLLVIITVGEHTSIGMTLAPFRSTKGDQIIMI